MGQTVAGERIDALDGLRGMLAIAVMLYHLIGFLWGVRLRAVGSYSVYIFFVLSGFAMAWVYDDERGGLVHSRRFFAARIARIIPLWWAATIATVVFQLPDFVGWNRLIENLTLLSALTPTPGIALGGWSIEIEAVFYLLFPLLLVLVRSTGGLLFVFVISLVIRFTYVNATWPPGSPSPSAALYMQMPTFFAFFVGGMLVARLRSAAPSSGRPWLPVLGFLIVAGVLSLNWVRFESLIRSPLMLLLTLACVVAVGCISMARNPSRLWQAALLRWLGMVSYATYLLHPLVYTVVRRLRMPSLVTLVVTVALTLTTAWCSYRWFEVPAARWTRRKLDQDPSLVA